MRLLKNTRAEFGAYSDEEAGIVSLQAARDAMDEIARWPGYAPSPLLTLDHLAAELGIGSILYKDESRRLGQGSFKVLGGAYAATLKLREFAPAHPVTLCCATDGNHGRSVAFAARKHGRDCVVFMHERAPASKAAAIEALGARVIRTPGTYDNSVREAARMADREGWVLIADTSEDAHDPTTRHVMQGYGVMVLEILEQLGSAPPPTHVFLQAGVGGMAAGIAGPLAEQFGERRPMNIIVEPETAAALYESALRGVPAKVGGDLLTAMEMLSAGQASPVAWPVLRRRADAFMTIGDNSAIAAREWLLRSEGRRVGAGMGVLDVGVSGVAGLAGLMRLAHEQPLAASLGLGPEARVLVIGTEAAPPP